LKGSRHRVLATMAVSALLAAGSNLLLRHAMSALPGSEGPLVIQSLTSPLVLLGLLGYAGSHLLWLDVLSRARLGAAFPLFVSSMFVMVLAGAVLFLGESLTVERLAGAILVAAGIGVAEYRRRQGPGEGEAQ